MKAIFILHQNVSNDIINVGCFTPTSLGAGVFFVSQRLFSRQRKAKCKARAKLLRK